MCDLLDLILSLILYNILHSRLLPVWTSGVGRNRFNVLVGSFRTLSVPARRLGALNEVSPRF